MNSIQRAPNVLTDYPKWEAPTNYFNLKMYFFFLHISSIARLDAQCNMYRWTCKHALCDVVIPEFIDEHEFSRKFGFPLVHTVIYQGYHGYCHPFDFDSNKNKWYTSKLIQQIQLIIIVMKFISKVNSKWTKEM